MKNYKSIAYLLMLAFLIGCSGTSTYEEVDYSMPELKYQPRIVYPREAHEKNIGGVSKVYLDISKTGKVAKVTLLKSSGHPVLDEAAMDYCKQMQFEPATKEGEAIECHMVQEIKFNLYEDYYSPMFYVKEIKDLYRLEANAKDEKKSELQDQIFEKHIEFIEEMSNDYNFNSFLAKVALPETCTDWERCWNDYPLTFLLYHDFIQRYPGYENIDLVKDHLKKALYTDLEFIKNSSVKNQSDEEAKMGLLVRIQRFVEKNYPDLSMNADRLSAGVKS